MNGTPSGSNWVAQWKSYPCSGCEWLEQPHWREILVETVWCTVYITVCIICLCSCLCLWRWVCNAQTQMLIIILSSTKFIPFILWLSLKFIHPMLCNKLSLYYFVYYKYISICLELNLIIIMNFIWYWWYDIKKFIESLNYMYRETEIADADTYPVSFTSVLSYSCRT